MKYTIEFTEVIAYSSQDIEANSKEEAIEEAFILMENNVIPIANSNMDYCISTERKEDPADRDDRLYHEEQDHIAMEKAKENK